jgi:hypothetical protein
MMRRELLYPIRILVALALSCLLCTLLGCSHPAEDTPRGDLGHVQWYVREVTRGEIVPLEGAHQHFEVFGQPAPLPVEDGRLQLTFDLPDGRRRRVIFLVRREGSLAMEVSCSRTSLEPDADALLREDRRLNEAISGHTPVSVAPGEWTTFFNDRLSGVFSSDWQLWWSEPPPD